MHFIKTRKIWYTISILMIVVCLFSIFTKGFNLGIDFLGGTSTIVKFADSSVDIGKLRTAVNDNNVVITKIVDDFIIKTKPQTVEKTKEFHQALEKSLGKFEILESDNIGPSIGKQLRSQSIWIVGLALLLILLYVTFRFELSYALGALFSEMHDAIFMIGMCSILQIEVNITTVVAILTILGYSINDTIVVFDRVREEVKNDKQKKDLADITNYSIYATLPRSINTSFTTLLTVIALYFWGGVTIREFALLLMIGILDGGYSSIFVAAPLMVGFKKMQEE